jgi:two-component system response regulator HydG
VLVVDDQKNMRATTALLLRQAGHRVAEAADGNGAVEALALGPYGVVLTDLRMPNVDGMQLLEAIQRTAPETQVIVMTAYGTIESAVEAIRHGAYDFLTKPFQEEEVLLRVGKAIEKRRLLGEVKLHAEEFRRRYGLEHVVGRSPSMREVLDRVMRVGPTDATVLITGESGTGKELVARALHVASPRSARPFVPVNCAAITETLLESELFGHARGAFTGAIRARRGLFEEADGGTLFIDEIGETSPGFQAKLLRALQDGEIRRVGESVSVRVDVRVVAATNQDLRRAIIEKRFREDLFYRLAVVPLRLPPLRERREDVPLLAAHFLRRFNQRTGSEKLFTAEAVARLLEHDYPGNVRELENAVEHAAAVSPMREIRLQDVHLESAGATQAGGPAHSLAEAVEETERRVIQASVVRNEHDLAKVARELGISSTTLWRKMKRLAIESRSLAGPT